MAQTTSTTTLTFHGQSLELEDLNETVNFVRVTEAGGRVTDVRIDEGEDAADDLEAWLARPEQAGVKAELLPFSTPFEDAVDLGDLINPADETPPPHGEP